MYDSGCFHHLPPHRRAGYIDLVRRAVAPGGAFGLVCFTLEGGSGRSDRQVYERRGLGGGLGYSAEQLRSMWDARPFVVRELRRMIAQSDGADRFGVDGLWAVLVGHEPA